MFSVAQKREIARAVEKGLKKCHHIQWVPCDRDLPPVGERVLFIAGTYRGAAEHIGRRCVSDPNEWFCECHNNDWDPVCTWNTDEISFWARIESPLR